MYMGPLEASKPWNTRDIVGVFRFLQRAWRLAIDERTGEPLLAAAPDPKVEKLLHRTIAKVGDGIERLSLNTAIAAMIELVNAATRPTDLADPAKGGMTRDQLDRFLRILWPFAPHAADEIAHRLGLCGDRGLWDAGWPAFDPAMLVDDEVEVAVQVQGKVRARIMVPAKAAPAEVEAIALAHPQVVPHLGGKAPKKVIVVPGRMVNVVV
jgi:leucyl-tRNA synthetase